MKLLEALAEQIKDLGSIKRVWFTSFNLNLDFFERHVLPTILQMDKPKNRIDYELMQQRINGNIASTEEKEALNKLDIAIFADVRMYDASDLKRTAIDVHSINPTLLNNAVNFSKQTLFHPKVIYLEADDGRAILGAGSANLTLSGWSNNQEVFAFRKIASSEQRKSVKAFFSPLFTSINQTEQSTSIARKLYSEADKQWKFIHSFAQPNFLDSLFKDSTKSGDHKLAIWSPYFPADLPKFISSLEAKIKQISGQSTPLLLFISPDRVENKLIRTKWSDEIEQLQKLKKLTFYNNAIHKHENCDLCHAKVWMTPERLAIGSWNFTTPGSNLLLGNETSHVNVEAGFVFEHDELLDKQLGKSFIADTSDFMNQESLDKEGLEVPELLPFAIQVSFDWRYLKYTVHLSNDSSLLNGYQLLLPDIDNLINVESLSNVTTEFPVIEPQCLLSQHSYEVRYHGRIVHRGFIIEKQAELRRVEDFDSLDDIFSSLISGAELEGNGNTSLRRELNTDQDPDDDNINNFTGGDVKPVSLSYFRMFQACAEFDTRLDKINSVSLLEQYAFVVPGCMTELKEKIEVEISREVNVLNWYMAQEYNSLVNAALTLEIGIDEELKLRLNSLFIDIEKNSHEPKKLGSKNYRNLIRKECKYVS
ncbi:MAG: hypothetical protein HRT73_01650 [Flavobacteriales bacterium]|nr:hypothetical protein [Flavobacteriales bacterium]